MIEFFNPDSIVPPASNDSQGVTIPANAHRLVISGQVGLRPDGSLVEGLEPQMEQCWLNLFGVLQAANMVKTDLIKVTVFVTVRNSVSVYRDVRDRMLDGHAPAATYLEVAGLAIPDFLVEIEGEAATTR